MDIRRVGCKYFKRMYNGLGESIMSVFCGNDNEPSGNCISGWMSVGSSKNAT
jgi:hypothetical protein